MTYRLQDLVDTCEFQTLLDRLYAFCSCPSAILDMEGNILASAGWQGTCAKFHRHHRESGDACARCERDILAYAAETGKAEDRRCPHGFHAAAVPIIVGGEQLGALFTRQFLLETPNPDFFRAQAEKYGFDVEAYLDALKTAPVWDQHRLDQYMLFVSGLVEAVSRTGLNNLQAIETRRGSEESENQIRAMFDNASIGMAQADPATGRLLRVNQRLCNITGYTAEELLSLRFSEFTHPGDRERDWKSFSRLVRDEIPHYMVEKRFLRKDGSAVWVNVNVDIVRGGTGQPEITMATIEDITERRTAEAALRESEERMHFALEVSHTGAWDLNLHDHTAFRTIEHDRIFGYAELLPDWTYEMFLNHVLEADRAEVDRKFRQAMEERGTWNFECRIVRCDGEQRWIWACGQHRQNVSGAGERMAGIVQDITARKQADEERVRLEEQLRQAQKLESVGRLAGGVAHDFNNLLGVIIGHAELALTRTEADTPLRDDLEEIRDAGQRSAELTRQLLTFARKQTIAPKVLDLNDTVAGTLKMLQRLIGENIHLEWHPAKEVWPVHMDPSQVDQILANLCVNARDAIADVGKVTIETGVRVFDEAYCANHPGYLPGEYSLLMVSDDGCGMDRKTLDNIFEPFFTTKNVGAGTGLGLAMVYGAVKQNHGFINVYSEPGSGTTFTIYFPRHAGETEPAQAPKAPERDLHGTETVLLVEDEPSILKLTRLLLTAQGYTVLAAASPAEAIRLAGEHPGAIDLLITDVVMPGMNGRDLTQCLIVNRPQLKCLFMSGYTANVIAHHGVLDQGVNFIQKPFTPLDLATKVRDVLESA